MKRANWTLLWLLSTALCSSAVSPAFAQSTSLADRPSPKIEVYPRYPVSYSFEPGPSISINSGRASVSVVIYSAPCDARPFDDTQVKTVITGNRIDVGPVRFAFQPICGFLGDHPIEVVYSLWLRELGPGTYQVAAAGELGDTPVSAGPGLSVYTMFREFVVLNMNQAAQALIENPSAGSTQSGIGLISGWACVADSVEISIDDGARFKVQGEMSRADVKPVCGHDTAGFGHLINFNTLGAGEHRLQVFVKGVPIGAPKLFTVVVPAGEFVKGLTREVAIPDFPAAGKTTTINWREAVQNFGVKDVR
jgi:hypothetical protein